VLKARVISALVLGLAALLLTWLGGIYFRALVAAGSAAIFYEWAMLSRGRERDPAIVMATVLLAVLLVGLLAGFTAVDAWMMVLGAAILSATMAILWWWPAWSAGGIIYAGVPAVSLALLRDVGPAGLTAILYLFATVWATDIMAYFVGRRLGGPKLAPSISPGKTWSGAVGGTVGGVVVGLVVVLLAGRGDFLLLGLLAIVLSVASQIGDLFESFLKRRFGVKDSGSLVPGHGGFMDRVDGLVAAAFVLYAAGAVTGGLETPSAALFASP